jgi:hypothetical protein
LFKQFLITAGLKKSIERVLHKQDGLILKHLLILKRGSGHCVILGDYIKKYHLQIHIGLDLRREKLK